MAVIKSMLSWAWSLKPPITIASIPYLLTVKLLGKRFSHRFTFILNKLEILITWNNKEIAISKNKGCIPCSQSSIFSKKRWHLGHKQEISITLMDESAYLNVKIITKGKHLKGRLVLQSSAKSISRTTSFVFYREPQNRLFSDGMKLTLLLSQ